MLNLIYRNNTLNLKTTEEYNQKILDQPLHKIYLKSTLKAEVDKDNYYWDAQEQEQIVSTIENILTHFGKYQIGIDLDNTCEEYLDIKNKEEEAFKDSIKNSLRIKLGNSDKNRDDVIKSLSPDFKRELKPYQLDAVNHLLTLRNGANFSVPGSGKTSIALAYFHILQQMKEVDALLVIGPASSFEPWESEYYKCFHVHPKATRIAGIPKEKRNQLFLLANRYDMLLTTYHSATRDVEQIINELKRRNYLVVLDESHNIKRPQGGKLSETVLKLSKYAKFRVILTGTPMPNSLEDLWSQFSFLWKEKSPLGSVDEYLQEIRSKDSGKTIESIKKRINPLYWRITKTQLNLPPVVFNIEKCELSPLQARIYRGVAIQFLTQLKEEPKDRETLRDWRRARALRLLQIATNPALLRKTYEEFSLPPMDLGNFPLKQGIEHYSKYEMPGKFHIIKHLVNKLCDSGNKVIIWTSFIHNLTMIQNMFSNYNAVMIHGSVPITSTDNEELTREKLIQKFKTDVDCKLLIANPAACAESISLHDVCHHAIYLDRTFNCAHYMQSLDRIHRIGLDHDQKTYYYILLVKDSIDEIIHDRLNAKMTNMEHVLEDELPGIVPGYWVNRLGEEEFIDFDLVESHIKSFK